MRTHWRQILLPLTVMAVVVLLPLTNAGADNVALNKPLTFNGTFNGGTDGRVVDGIFMPRGTVWTSGTAYWNGLAPNIVIDLQGIYTIDSMIVQADDNDAYRVEYWNGSTWQTAWNVPNYDAYGWGLQTRPNPANDAEKYFLPSPITTNKLRFMAASGDNGYSVSEIQAFGAIAVPIPVSFLLLGSGLAGLCAWGRGRVRKS